MSDLEIRRAMNVLRRYANELDPNMKREVITAIGGVLPFWVEIDEGDGDEPQRLYFAREERLFEVVLRNLERELDEWDEDRRDDFLALWKEAPNEALDEWNDAGGWPKIRWGDCWINP